MDAAAAKSALDLAAQHGFNALLVVILLAAIWRLLERQDRRDDERDAKHRTERLEMHQSNIAAIGRIYEDVQAIRRRIERDP